MLNYSTVEVNIQIQKIISYPIFLLLMTIFSGLIMLNTKRYKSDTFKISLGLFFCVIIYYLNNLFNVLGLTEKIHYIIAVWSPIFFLFLIISIMSVKINER